MSDKSSVSGRKRGRPKKPEFKNKPDTTLKLINADTIAHLKNLKQSNNRILMSTTKVPTPTPMDTTSSTSVISTPSTSKIQAINPPIAMDITSSTSVPDIPTSNKFDILPSDVNTSNTTINIENNKKKYVPPIIIQGLNLNQIIEILKTNKITDYKLKLLSIGIKVTPGDIIVSKTLTNLLKTSEIEFFTFSDRSLNPLKVILSGLPPIQIDEIKTELISLGISKELIFEIISLQRKDKQHNIHNNTNYLIKFDKTKITMKFILGIKSMFNIIIRWFPYISYRNGPTQCRRCQMYGHGTSHCNKIVKCLKCSGGHTTDTCNATIIKCANCGEPHEANFDKCITRSQYVAIRENMSINRKISNLSSKPANFSKTLTSSQLAQHNSLQKNEVNFPTITQRDSQAFRESQQQWKNNFSTPPPPIHHPSGEAGINNELFSIEDLSFIVTEIIQKMVVCKTRAQQLEVIFQISLRYLCKP